MVTTTKPPNLPSFFFLTIQTPPNTITQYSQKTTLQITTHNTAKNMHDIQATVLHHFNKGTDILCLQEIPSNITLANSLGLTTFENYVPDKTNLRRLRLHGQNAPKTASPRHCEKIVLLGGT